MSSTHTILAINKYKLDKDGKPKKRRFTPAAFNSIPSMNVGKKVVERQGWIQVTDTVPEEAAEIINKQTETVPEDADKLLEDMSAKELLDYVSKNSIEIENADSLSRTKLYNAIRKIQA